MSDHPEYSSAIEREEFLKIIKCFPGAKLKADYNREILDIGAEIPYEGLTFILLKGDQTNHQYELVTPECHCIEGLQSLSQVKEVCVRLSQEIHVDYGHELTREKGRNE